MLRVAKFGELALETCDFGSADESGRLNRLPANIHQFSLEFAMQTNQIDKWNIRVLCHPFTFAGVGTERKTFAGLPATIVFAGTSRVTTLPAPTIAFSPIVKFARIVAPEPIEAPRFTSVFSTCQSASVCSPPSGVVARG